MARLHWVAALLVCLVIPGASWLQGSGWLAWVMYSKSAMYRLSIVATEANGDRRRIAPMELGVHARQYAARFLSGSERFRHAPVGSTIRAHLSEFAELACSVTRARSVDLTLEERPDLDSPIIATQAHRECAGSAAR
jgi:hypothetical protein